MNTVYRLFMLGAACFAILASPLQAQIRSSDFDTGSVPSGWVFLNPLSDASISFTASQASISVPFGISHDPVDGSSGGNRAPALRQEIATPGTDFGNFEVFAKFDSPMSSQYQMMGIEVVQDQFNYVRCEFYSDGSSINYLLWSFTNAGNPDGIFQWGAILPNTTAPLYMRVRRVGDKFYQYYSTGTSWTLSDSVTHILNADSIGVYVANSDGTSPGTNAPAFTGLIDLFQTADPLPIQLASFTATVVNRNNVHLDWMTLTETNNYGFYVQRAPGNSTTFARIEGSFLPGHGTTITPHSYEYVDITAPGMWRYRLEQIDLDGSTHYSDPVQITILTGVDDRKSLPKEFALRQNYPNPFNPSTKIGFDLPKESFVKLEVFNLIGQKVATLVNDVRPAGTYQISFPGSEGSNLTSGVYIYTLTSGDHIFTKKMILMK